MVMAIKPANGSAKEMATLWYVSQSQPIATAEMEPARPTAMTWNDAAILVCEPRLRMLMAKTNGNMMDMNRKLNGRNIHETILMSAMATRTMMELAMP